MILDQEHQLQVFCAALQGQIVADATIGGPHKSGAIVQAAVQIAKEAIAALKSDEHF